jgi:hypothetical protein
MTAGDAEVAPCRRLGRSEMKNVPLEADEIQRLGHHAGAPRRLSEGGKRGR